MLKTRLNCSRLGLPLGLLLLTWATTLTPAIAKPPPPKARPAAPELPGQGISSPPTELWRGYDLTTPPELRPDNPPAIETRRTALPTETRQGYDCLQRTAEPFPVALNPGRVLPLTVSGHPTFFWYMPQVSAGYLEFALAKPTDDTLERETIVHYTRLTIPEPIPERPAVIGYQLPPEQLEALDYQQLYRWSVVLFCRAPGEINHDLSDGIVASGWVERLHPDDPIAQQVSDATSEQVERFAGAGIWHEALTGIAHQRLARPQDPQAETNWQDLLGSVGWEMFTDLPIVIYRADDGALSLNSVEAEFD